MKFKKEKGAPFIWGAFLFPFIINISVAQHDNRLFTNFQVRIVIATCKI